MKIVRQKSKYNSTKSTVIFLVIFFITGFFTACQHTPEKEVVIQKDNFENLVDNTPESISKQEENIEAIIEHITWVDERQKITKTPEFDDITLDMTISIDAMVDLSPKTAPVFIVKPAEYDMEFIKNATHYFFGDDYYNSVRTKSDWLMKLLPLKNKIDIIGERTKSLAEYYIDYWKNKHNEAPDNSKQAEFVFNEGYYNIFCIKGYPYTGALSEMFVQNGGMSNTLFYYYVDDINKYYGETRYEYKDGESAIGMTTSYEDAKNLAQEAVQNIYGDNMAIVQTTMAIKGQLDEDWTDVILAERITGEDKSKDQGYIFYFTKTYNDIPQLYAPKASNNDSAESEQGGYVNERSWDYEYSMKWPAEYVMVTVDDTGIVEFWGYSPTEIEEMVNSNVEMLEFGEILDIFKQNIYYNSVWTNSLTEKLDINITNIKFGMVRVPKKDDPNIFYMVPSWQFIGSKSVSTSLSSYGNYDETGKTFMVLNAIDGGIIDTSYYENNRLEALNTLGEQEYVNQMDYIDPPPN